MPENIETTEQVKTPSAEPRALVMPARAAASQTGSDTPGAGRLGRHAPPAGLVNEKDDEATIRIATLTQALEKSGRDMQVLRSQVTDLVAANELLHKEKNQLEANAKLAPVVPRTKIDPEKAIYTGPSLTEIYLCLISGIFARIDPTNGNEMSDRKVSLLSQSLLGVATTFHKDAKLRPAFNVTQPESPAETTQSE